MDTFNVIWPVRLPNSNTSDGERDSFIYSLHHQVGLISLSCSAERVTQLKHRAHHAVYLK